uniref:Uncharacterized protein n=1 Tax=Oryctolagus cuniculus TaxID=9986 RepID=A0A5F9DA23_RABIT
MSYFQINLSPPKLQLSFIRILEWIASIFTFTTCGGFKGKTEVLVNCPPWVPDSKTIAAGFGYPCRNVRCKCILTCKFESSVAYYEMIHIFLMSSELFAF